MVQIKRTLEFTIDRQLLTFEATLYDDHNDVVDSWSVRPKAQPEPPVKGGKGRAKRKSLPDLAAQFEAQLQDAFLDIYGSFDQ